MPQKPKHFKKFDFEYPEFYIRILNPDYKMSFLTGFSRLFWSIELNENMLPRLQSFNYFLKIKVIFEGFMT